MLSCVDLFFTDGHIGFTTATTKRLNILKKNPGMLFVVFEYHFSLFMSVCNVISVLHYLYYRV